MQQTLTEVDRRRLSDEGRTVFRCEMIVVDDGEGELVLGGVKIEFTKDSEALGVDPRAVGRELCELGLDLIENGMAVTDKDFTGVRH